MQKQKRKYSDMEKRVDRIKNIGYAKKGKTYEDLYGIEKAKVIKEKQGAKHRGSKGYWEGKKFPQSTRDKLSKIRKGRKFTEEHKRNIGLALENRIMDEEWRKKLSEAKKGRPPFQNVKSGTVPELIMEQWLLEQGHTSEPQKMIEEITIADYFIEPNILIFVDGVYWHKGKRKAKDEKKTQYLSGMGYHVYRITDLELLQGIFPTTLKNHLE